MIDQELHGHIMSLFYKDDYMKLKQDWTGYTHVSTLYTFEYLFDEYGKKIEELQNKVFEDLNEDVNLSGSSVWPLKSSKSGWNYSTTYWTGQQDGST